MKKIILILIGLIFLLFLIKPLIKYKICEKKNKKEISDFSNEINMQIIPSKKCTYSLYSLSIKGIISNNLVIQSNQYNIILEKGKVDTLIKNIDYYGTYIPKVKILPDKKNNGKLLITQSIE